MLQFWLINAVVRSRLSCVRSAVREEESKFRTAAAEGCNLLPLTRCIFSDHLTPVLAYRCLVKEDDREAPSFLFESVEQGSEGTNVVSHRFAIRDTRPAGSRPLVVQSFHRACDLQGRYSVVGAQPAMEIVAKANHVTVMDHEMKSRREHFVPDPMKIPRTIMEQWNPQITDGLPDAFCGTLFPPSSYSGFRMRMLAVICVSQIVVILSLAIDDTSVNFL